MLKFSDTACFKMGIDNLRNYLVKTVSVIIVASITLLMISVAQVLLAFSSEKTLAKFIYNCDIDYITVSQGRLSYGNELNPDILKPSTFDYIDGNSDCIVNNVIKSKQHIADMGLSFIGDAVELDDRSYYLTTKGLDRAYNDRNSYIDIDGKKIKLIKDLHPPEFIVGKKVDFGYAESTDYTVAGVVDLLECNPLITYLFPDYFVLESFEGSQPSFRTFNVREFPEVYLHFGDIRFSREFRYSDKLSSLIFSSRGGGKIMTEQGMISVDDMELAENEIVLTYEMYMKLFTVEPPWSYVNTDLTEVLRYPIYLGKVFPVKIFESGSEEMLIDVGNLKLVGIVFAYDGSIDYPFHRDGSFIPGFATGKITAERISKALQSPKFLIEIASVNNLQKFLVGLRRNYEGFVVEAGEDVSENYARFVYEFEHELYIYKIIFLSIAVGLSLVSILFIAGLISSSIAYRKREVEVLSAFGVRNRNICKIFIYEILPIIVVTFIIALTAILIGVAVFNDILGSYIFLDVWLLRFDIISFIILLVSSVVLPMLATFLPLIKILRLKPNNNK